MSPAHAALAKGVSRWTIMRAIKSGELVAYRDNKNQWRITSEELEAWRPHSDAAHHELQGSHTADDLSVKLQEANTRASLAEALLNREREALQEMRAERDAWKEEAQRLTAALTRHASWWPWKLRK